MYTKADSKYNGVMKYGPSKSVKSAWSMRIASTPQLSWR